MIKQALNDLAKIQKEYAAYLVYNDEKFFEKN